MKYMIYDEVTKKIPFFQAGISAGFPSPATDYIENDLDLNSHLIEHPYSTYFIRVNGDSMIDAGINSGDILIVDKSKKVCNNSIVIACLNGEFTVKKFLKNHGKIFLIPENDNYSVLEITPDMEFSIWGIVTYVIHKL